MTVPVIQSNASEVKPAPIMSYNHFQDSTVIPKIGSSGYPSSERNNVAANPALSFAESKPVPSYMKGRNSEASQPNIFQFQSQNNPKDYIQRSETIPENRQREFTHPSFGRIMETSDIQKPEKQEEKRSYFNPTKKDLTIDTGSISNANEQSNKPTPAYLKKPVQAKEIVTVSPSNITSRQQSQAETPKRTKIEAQEEISSKKDSTKQKYQIDENGTYIGDTSFNTLGRYAYRYQKMKEKEEEEAKDPEFEEELAAHHQNIQKDLEGLAFKTDTNPQARKLEDSGSEQITTQNFQSTTPTPKQALTDHSSPVQREGGKKYFAAGARNKVESKAEDSQKIKVLTPEDWDKNPADVSNYISFGAGKRVSKIFKNNEAVTRENFTPNQEVFSNVSQVMKNYSSPQSERIEYSCRPTKVEISNDGKSVWYGGEGLGINQRLNYWYIDDGMLSTDLQFCTIKTMKNGFLIVNDFRNWDLIMFDNELNEKNRLKGHGTGTPNFYRSISTRTWYDDQYLAWLSSPQDVSAVRLIDFTFKTVEGFWNHKNTNSQPIAVVLGAAGNKLYGLGEAGSHIQTLHCYNNDDDTVSAFELYEMFNLGKIRLIE